MKKLYATLLLLSLLTCMAACSQPTYEAMPTVASGGSAPAQTVQSINRSTQTSRSATPTPAAEGVAATAGGGGPQSYPLPSGVANPNGNSVVIDSPADRPVAIIVPTTLNVPLRSKLTVYIINNSSSPHTLVSDTANGWQPFTIKSRSYILLTFTRRGTFKGHLQEYPNAHITIIIPQLLR